jgi:hypothetical protein
MLVPLRSTGICRADGPGQVTGDVRKPKTHMNLKTTYPAIATFTVVIFLSLQIEFLSAEEPKPGDKLFVIKQFSVATDSGIHGLRVGKEVVMVREDIDQYVIMDGDIEASASKDSFTTDASFAEEVRTLEQQKVVDAFRASELDRQKQNDEEEVQGVKEGGDQKSHADQETSMPMPPSDSSARDANKSHQQFNPEYNGVPLSEIIGKAIIANIRAPIYDISGGDSSFCEAVDKIHEKYPDQSNATYDAYRERFEALQTIAKNAHPEKILGYVRPGFMFIAMNWKSTESAPVAFPKPIGGCRFGAVRWSDFSYTGKTTSRKWWNDSVQDPLSGIPEIDVNDSFFKEYSLTVKTQLFDPFEASDAILSNADNTMIKAWVVQSSDPSISNRFVRNGSFLSVVETRDGLFLGYLSEKGDSGLSQITWEQATSETNTPFELKKERTQDLKSGSKIFSLFDSAKRTRKRTPSNNPQEFVLFPETFSDVLQMGTWALTTSLAVPSDSGFEPLQELETQATFQFEIQKRLERIEIQFDSLDDDKLRLLVISEYRRREVERKRNANGGESVAAKPWRKLKEQLSTEVALSGDGSVLFTDGEAIFQISEGRMKKPVLNFFSVKKNRLYR